MALELIPPRVPLTDPRTGSITREWYRFFQALYNRAGGPNAETPADIAQDMADDGGLEELKATTYDLTQQFGQAPRQEIELAAALELISSLRDEVAELTKAVEALQAGVLL